MRVRVKGGVKKRSRKSKFFLIIWLCERRENSATTV